MTFGKLVSEWMGAYDSSPKGKFDHVGVRSIRVPGSVLIRVFYPAKRGTSSPAKWFQHSMHHTTMGHIHALGIQYATWKYRIVSVILRIISFFLPIYYMDVPFCYNNAEPTSVSSKLPLIMCSHGLTGTGEEHTLLFSNLARNGNVVVCVTHQDGSACRAVVSDGSHLHYEHPILQGYNRKFRIKQVLQREKEVLLALRFVLHDPLFPSHIRDMIDESIVLTAGFSFGAATAAQVAANNPDKICACVLLDGWFRIDLSVFKGFAPHDFEDLPPDAHRIGYPHPTLALTSHAFSVNKILAAGTSQILRKFPQVEHHLIEGAQHQCFTELFLWFPGWILTRTAKLPADTNVLFTKIQTHVLEFVERVTREARERKSAN
eukprot:c12865_g1_i3.p1 GENE.c12865_g1_i3~~c12865_g1_i3.p1  ORF type:complete len:376 (-),score=80.07 c12865_g1_i3:1713-2840(-)